MTTSAPSLPVRFELRTGRFGSYFYDTRTQTDVDLVQTLKYLNAYAEYTDADIEAMLDGLEGKGGYNWAIPERQKLEYIIKSGTTH